MSKVYATASTFVGHDGQSVWVEAGDEFDASDPLVKAARDLFTKPEPEPGPVEKLKSRRVSRD